MSFKVVESKIAILENYLLNDYSTNNPIILKPGDILRVDLNDGNHIIGKLIMFEKNEDCFCLKIDTSKTYFYCCTKIIFNQEGGYVTNDNTTSDKVKSVSVKGTEIDNLEAPDLFRLFKIKILKFYTIYENDEFFYNLIENFIVDVNYWEYDEKLPEVTTGRFKCIRTIEHYRGYNEYSIILDTSEDKNGSSKSIKLDDIISIRDVLPYPFEECSHTPNSDESCTD